MKKVYSFAFVSLAAVLSFLFLSCDFFNPAESGKDVSGVFTLSGSLVTDINQNADAFPSGFLDSSGLESAAASSREAFPSYVTDALYYSVSCSNGTATFEGNVDSSDPSNMTFKVDVPSGSSTVTAKAFIDEAKTKQVYKGTLLLQDVKEDSDLSGRTIELTDIHSGAEKTATVSLPISIKSGTKISKISATVMKDNASFGSGPLVFTVSEGKTYYFSFSDNLSEQFSETQAAEANSVPGVYDVEFSFFAGDSASSSGEYLAFWTKQKIIASNYLSTENWNGNDEDSCINANSNILEVTEKICKEFLSDTFYIDSSSGSDSGSGSFSSPFKTIQKAVNVIQSLGKTESCTVFLKGDITADLDSDCADGSFVKIEDSANLTLVIKAYPSGSAFSINANGRGRVLYIGSGNNVTLKNVTLEKGNARDSDSQGGTNGGAVYVGGNGTLSLENCTVSSCVADGFGNAVYLDSSSVMNGYFATGESGTGATSASEQNIYLKTDENASSFPGVNISLPVQDENFRMILSLGTAESTSPFDYSKAAGKKIMTFTGTETPSSENLAKLVIYNEKGTAIETDYSVDSDGNLAKAETLITSWTVLKTQIEDETRKDVFDATYKIGNITDFTNSQIYINGSSATNKLSVVSSENVSITGSSAATSGVYFQIQGSGSTTIGSQENSITFGPESGTYSSEFIYVTDSANPSLLNCIFRNSNTRAVETSGTLLLENCKFQNISISDESYGSVYVNGGTATVDSCTFTGCTGYNIYTKGTTASGKVVLKGNLSDTSIYIENSSTTGVVTFDRNLSFSEGAKITVKIYSYTENAAVFASSDGGTISEAIRNHFTVTDEAGASYTINENGTLSTAGGGNSGSESQTLTYLYENKNSVSVSSGAEYTVSSELELFYLSSLVNDDNFTFENATVKQTSDIILSTYSNWTPIGTSSASPFSGTFDGQNNKITGLAIEATESHRALFGYTSDANLKNINISGSITAAGVTLQYIAGVVGEFTQKTGTVLSEITNCTSSVSISFTGGSSELVGGIAGKIAANDTIKITNCAFNGTISASGMSKIGGIAGQASYNVIFYNCENSGTIYAKGNAGGIFGYGQANKNGTQYELPSVKNCVCNVALSNISVRTSGGLIGNYNATDITDAFADYSYYITSSTSDYQSIGTTSYTDKDTVFKFSSDGTKGTLSGGTQDVGSKTDLTDIVEALNAWITESTLGNDSSFATYKQWSYNSSGLPTILAQ